MSKKVFLGKQILKGPFPPKCDAKIWKKKKGGNEKFEKIIFFFFNLTIHYKLMDTQKRWRKTLDRGVNDSIHRGVGTQISGEILPPEKKPNSLLKNPPKDGFGPVYKKGPRDFSPDGVPTLFLPVHMPLYLCQPAKKPHRGKTRIFSPRVFLKPIKDKNNI